MTTKPKGKTRGRPPKLSRETLLMTALRLFAEHGYGGTSFQMIADRCGLSQTAVVYHFPSKLKLLGEIIEHVIRHNHQLVQAQANPYDDAPTRLRKHFFGNAEWAVRFREESQIILLLYYLAAFQPEFQSLYQRMLENARGRIIEILAAGKREKRFRSSLREPETAALLHDSLLGGIVNLLASGGGKKELRELRATWERAFQQLVD